LLQSFNGYINAQANGGVINIGTNTMGDNVSIGNYQGASEIDIAGTVLNFGNTTTGNGAAVTIAATSGGGNAGTVGISQVTGGGHGSNIYLGTVASAGTGHAITIGQTVSGAGGVVNLGTSSSGTGWTVNIGTGGSAATIAIGDNNSTTTIGGGVLINGSSGSPAFGKVAGVSTAGAYGVNTVIGVYNVNQGAAAGGPVLAFTSGFQVIRTGLYRLDIMHITNGPTGSTPTVGMSWNSPDSTVNSPSDINYTNMTKIYDDGAGHSAHTFSMVFYASPGGAGIEAQLNNTSFSSGFGNLWIRSALTALA
jgi:hypothetical protein